MLGVLSSTVSEEREATRNCYRQNPKNTTSTTTTKKDSGQASSKPMLEVPIQVPDVVGGGEEKAFHQQQRHQESGEREAAGSFI